MNTSSLLNTLRLPARLDVGQTAEVLGLQVHDVATLVAARLLVPLAHPRPNGPKFFAAVDLERLAKDRAWCEKAQRALNAHWLKKNAQRSRPTIRRTE